LSLSRITIIFLIPFFIKIPVFGLHFWLPKAHVEARTSGSIILAGILLKLGSYGAARVTYFFLLRTSWSRVSRIWIILALTSRLVTFIQRDLKKLVAYRRVTHITFIVVGLVTRSKLLLGRVILISLSHGWAAIALFSRVGTLRNSTNSRIGFLSGSETSLFWWVIVIGLVLISNAGIPPIPSFFPEVFIISRRIRIRGYSVLVFLGLRFLVCYYNAYLFLWISHIKGITPSSSKVFFLERFIPYYLVLLRVESLFFLQIF